MHARGRSPDALNSPLLAHKVLSHAHLKRSLTVSVMNTNASSCHDLMMRAAMDSHLDGVLCFFAITNSAPNKPPA